MLYVWSLYACWWDPPQVVKTTKKSWKGEHYQRKKLYIHWHYKVTNCEKKTCSFWIMPKVEDLFKLYFTDEFSNKAIFVMLALNRHIIIGIWTLKRHCHKLHLFRSKHYTDLDERMDFVYQELQHIGQMQGINQSTLNASITTCRGFKRICHTYILYIYPRGMSEHQP